MEPPTWEQIPPAQQTEILNILSQMIVALLQAEFQEENDDNDSEQD